MKEVAQLKIEKLRLELTHYWNIICNALWIVSIFAAFIITAILSGNINFYAGLLIFSLFALILAIALLPISRKCTIIRKIDIPELEGEIKKLK